jgi:ABC-type uncharacterized transport system permease subunit
MKATLDEKIEVEVLAIADAVPTKLRVHFAAVEDKTTFNETTEVTALHLLLGGRSVGQEDGSLSVWFAVRQKDDSFTLTRIHRFPNHPGAIRAITPSQRDKGFLALAGGVPDSSPHRGPLPCPLYRVREGDPNPTDPA